MVIETFISTAYAAAENLPGAGPKQAAGILDMILHAGLMVKFILLTLVGLSVGCWCVICIKTMMIRRARKESEAFTELFRQRRSYAFLYKESQLLNDSHLAEIFRLGYVELTRLSKSLESKSFQELRTNPEVILENVDRAMQGGVMGERQRFERFLPLLATTGSTAPFIGLFGTVWGIMTSFQDIGLKGAASLAVVAPGISEALVATAIGLGAAIPAVVAYNHFSNKIRVIENEMIHFAADFLNLLKRDLMRKGKGEEQAPESQRLAVSDE